MKACCNAKAQELTRTKKNIILNTKMPPWEIAWGSDRVPAPTQVVRRIKMEETTVPLVALDQRPRSLATEPWGLSITGEVGGERAECTKLPSRL